MFDCYGKFWLFDYVDWFFNLLYFVGWMFVGISRVGLIGVDLEVVWLVFDFFDIVECFFVCSEVCVLVVLFLV